MCIQVLSNVRRQDTRWSQVIRHCYGACGRAQGATSQSGLGCRGPRRPTFKQRQSPQSGQQCKPQNGKTLTPVPCGHVAATKSAHAQFHLPEELEIVTASSALNCWTNACDDLHCSSGPQLKVPTRDTLELTLLNEGHYGTPLTGTGHGADPRFLVIAARAPAWCCCLAHRPYTHTTTWWPYLPYVQPYMANHEPMTHDASASRSPARVSDVQHARMSAHRQAEHNHPARPRACTSCPHP